MKAFPFANRMLGCAALAAALLAGGAAHAGALSFAGSFAADDERAVFSIRWAADTHLFVNTTAWPLGGFAPVLSLFDAGGSLLQLDVGSSHVCGTPGAGAPDPQTGFCWGALIDAPFAAGTYTLVLTQDGNLPNGPFLADGFSQDGFADYTGVNAGRPGARFVNVDGSQRSGQWALTIEADGLQPVPEPAASALVALGLATLALSRRRLLNRP